MKELRKSRVGPVLLALALLSGACKVNPVRVAISGRDGWQHPERVIATLGIGPGDVVAEIGAGEGYWIPWLSRAVGPTGRVYAVDVEEEPIAALRALVANGSLANVEVVFGTFEDPLLPDREIDLVLTSLTYHHIDDRPAYFARLRLDLSGEGRVVHLDDRDDLPLLLRWMPTAGHWSSPERMHDEMTQAGYVRLDQFDFLLTQTFQVFEPLSPSGG